MNNVTALRTSNEQFVIKLYEYLLERSPETEAIQHWTTVLASGVSRSDVLEEFMASPEFIALQTRKETARLSFPSPADRHMDERQMLSYFKAHVARHQTFVPDEVRPSGPEVVANEERPSGPESLPNEDQRWGPEREGSEADVSPIARLSAEVWASKEAVGQLNPRNPGLLNQLAQASKKALQRMLSWYTRSLQGFHYEVARALEAHGRAIDSIEQSLRRVGSRTELFQESLRTIERRVEQSLSEGRFKTELLQESLRTTELAIQEQLMPYVEFFRGLAPVVDLGCGRGEFLALLKQNGVAAYGVDSDPAACEVAR